MNRKFIFIRLRYLQNIDTAIPHYPTYTRPAQQYRTIFNKPIKLKKLIKANDTLIILPGQGHNGMSDNPDYITEIKKILK